MIGQFFKILQLCLCKAGVKEGIISAEINTGLKEASEQGMVAPIFSSGTQEAEAGRSL